MRTLAAAFLLSLGLAQPAWSQEADRVPDSEILAWAAEACKAKDFTGFFGHFAQNPAVFAAHVGPKVEIRRLAAPHQLVATVAGQDYRDFKIAMIDYSWVDADSAARVEAGKGESFEDLELTFSDLGKDSWRVGYTKAEFQGEHELVRTYGQPGAYVFAFRDGCWRLTQDLR
ncbi:MULTISPECIES: hypothetical protein [unclassified Inquilinus]|uniref:hypothetical protein n=1 Tax=unclassified Inquilinus TaxID=2645927 RepID=UPI003F91D892